MHATTFETHHAFPLKPMYTMEGGGVYAKVLNSFSPEKRDIRK